MDKVSGVIRSSALVAKSFLLALLASLLAAVTTSNGG